MQCFVKCHFQGQVSKQNQHASKFSIVDGACEMNPTYNMNEVNITNNQRCLNTRCNKLMIGTALVEIN